MGQLIYFSYNTIAVAVFQNSRARLNRQLQKSVQQVKDKQKPRPFREGGEMKKVAEAERGAVGVPVVVQPVPVQHHLVAVLVEIRDVQVAVTVPHENV